MKHEITSQNTKRMLVDTFLELLQKKSLSKTKGLEYNKWV